MAFAGAEQAGWEGMQKAVFTWKWGQLVSIDEACVTGHKASALA